MDTRIHDDEALQRTIGDLPVLASTPLLRTEGNTNALPALTAPTSHAAERFRTLRTSVELSMRMDVRSVLVTSAWASEGKSTTAANLGVSLAQAGRRILLVDCDLRRPTVASFFGLSNDTGLTSYLVGDARLLEVIQTVKVNEQFDLSVITAGPNRQNPAELLDGNGLSQLLEAADYDIILLDSPPVLPVADALLVAQVADAAIVVASAGRTQKRKLSDALNRLSRTGIDVLGTVLTAEKETNRGRNYRDYYYESDIGDDDPTSSTLHRGGHVGAATSEHGEASSSGPGRSERSDADQGTDVEAAMLHRSRGGMRAPNDEQPARRSRA